MTSIHPRLVALAALSCVVLSPAPALADFDTLDLERRCGQCHDVASSGALTGEDWLARMRALGPIDQLEPSERAEIVGFLRHHGWEVNQIMGMASERHLFEEKCGLCHAVERVFVKKMDDQQMQATVERMRLRAPEWISEQEAETIVAFMRAGARGVPRPEHRVIEGGPAEAFKGRCAGCHPLERAYLYLETELEPHWPLLVKRMQVKAPEWISDEEADLIVEYLSGLQPQLRPAAATSGSR